MFKRLEYKEAVDFLLPLHYSGRVPSISYAFGYFEDDMLKAVITYGKPASNALCKGVCGEEFSSKVYELNRMCAVDSIEIQLSKFVSWTLRYLKQFGLIIVSYADTIMNHNGYVYQACNFIYTGKTKERTDKYVDGNKHSRHYSKEQDNSLRKFRSAKHRYIYFCGSSTERKQFKQSLKYKIEAYLKGENKKYVLGDYLKPIVISNGLK